LSRNDEVAYLWWQAAQPRAKKRRCLDASAQLSYAAVHA
jgi:hypothetical protein